MNESPQPSVEEAAAAPAPPSHRSALFIVFLVVFIDLLGFGIVLPLLPRYGDHFLQDLISGGKDSILGGVILGLLLSSFSAMQFVFAPIWGRISDRVGRRPILLIGLFGSVVFYALFGVASELSDRGLGLTLLFVARIGAGIAGATIATAQAVIADSTTPERRSRGMALIGAAFGIGFTFGPLIGAGARAGVPDMKGAPGFAAAIVSLIAFVLGLLLLPETWRPGGSAGRRAWLDWRGLQKTLQTPVVGLLVLVFFLATFAFGNFEATLSLVTQEAFSLPDEKNYLLFAYVGLVLMVAQGLIYRRLAMRVKETTFMKLGLILMVSGLAAGMVVLYFQAGTPASGVLLTYFLLTLAVAVTGFALVTPSIQSLISRLSDPSKQGEVLGVNQSASALARILGPAIALPLFKLDKTHLLPYALGAGLLMVVYCLTPRINQA